ASDNGIIERNPFKNLGIKHKKNSQGDREAFNADQLQSIKTAIQLERTSKPYRYWGVMLGIYTGARLNEIAQLELGDIKEAEGVWYFDINDLPDENSTHHKRLKNESSKRHVPIHDALLSAGIIEYVEQLRKAGHKRLFPDLNYVEGHKYGRKLGRWFNETLLVSLGMKGSKLTFHSFRHTATTALLNAGVQEAIVKDLLGHAKEGTTQAVYNKGYGLPILQANLNRLSYEN
ncbi:MAG: integrase, partial [Cyanobacteria bacterium PR.023]|nr:integrase [Cyanobacteria bacterium PR.023]